MDVIDFPYGRRQSVGTIVTATGERASGLERRPTACMHTRVPIGRLTLDLCPDTDQAVWMDGDEVVDSAEALARLFGDFDLETAMPALRAPGEIVLAYRPDGRRARTMMRSLPCRRWIEGAPGLWLTHDHEYLLMSPVDRLLADNLMRGL